MSVLNIRDSEGPGFICKLQRLSLPLDSRSGNVTIARKGDGTHKPSVPPGHAQLLYALPIIGHVRSSERAEGEREHVMAHKAVSEGAS